MMIINDNENQEEIRQFPMWEVDGRIAWQLRIPEADKTDTSQKIRGDLDNQPELNTEKEYSVSAAAHQRS